MMSNAPYLKFYPIGLVFTCALLLPFAIPAKTREASTKGEPSVTVLSTMLTEFRGVGEWGFAALVEVDGRRILFDTGGRPGTVLQNAAELGLELDDVEEVVLSHNHWDHTGGLTTLRRKLREANPKAVARTHVAEGIFLPRQLDEKALGSLPPMPREFVVNVLEVQKGYSELGGQFTVHAGPREIHAGVWLTGPIPRIHPEKNWTPFMRIKEGDKLLEDPIPEDQALVLETSQGLIVICGCGHAGLINTLEAARKITKQKRVYAVIGGFHLMSSSDEHIRWTAKKLQEFGVQHILGAHCTGINAVKQLRDAGSYNRETAVVGSVGSRFSVSKGIERGLLNR